MSSTSIRSNTSEDSSTSIALRATTRSDLNVVDLVENKVDPVNDVVDAMEDVVDLMKDVVDPMEDVVEYTDVPLCRICWLDGSIDELIALPCRCQGTVGNVHADCLKEWERVRKTRRCEICREVYMKTRNFTTVLRSFFQYQYAGIFFIKMTNIAATALIAYANIVMGEMNIAYLNSVIKASPSRSGTNFPVILLSVGTLSEFLRRNLHPLSEHIFQRYFHISSSTISLWISQCLN